MLQSGTEDDATIRNEDTKKLEIHSPHHDRETIGQRYRLRKSWK
jgi:hypothetical protein